MILLESVLFLTEWISIDSAMISTFRLEQTGPLPCLSRSGGGTLHRLRLQTLCRAMLQLYLRDKLPTESIPWVKRRAVTSWHKSNHNQIIKHRCLWGLRSSSPRVPYCLLNKYFVFLIEFDILPFWFQNIGPLQTIK